MVRLVLIFDIEDGASLRGHHLGESNHGIKIRKQGASMKHYLDCCSNNLGHCISRVS